MNLPAIRNLTDPDVLVQGYRDVDYQQPEVLKDKLRQAAILWVSFDCAAAAMYPILGRLLDFAQRNKTWELWGYHSFGDFIVRHVQGELKVPHTKAYDAWKLMRNWPEIDDRVAKEIGVSKLRELNKVEGETHRDEWIEKAKTLPVSDFKDEVATHIGSTVAGQKLKRVEFGLRSDTLDLWEETIASVIREIGTDNWDAIVEALCGEWASK